MEQHGDDDEDSPDRTKARRTVLGIVLTASLDASIML